MDGSKFDDAHTGEQRVQNFNLNFGPQHPAAHGGLRLVQEYRKFDFMSPWEGADYILPGDDKPEVAKG